MSPPRAILPDAQFGTIDYIIFGLLLSFSTWIGIYYGFMAKRKQNTTTEYILGGKQMTLWPVAISLVVSHISGMTILGLPVDVYAYGIQMWISCFTTLIIVGLIFTNIFLPVFYELQLESCFEYLERRFDRNTKFICSTIFFLSVFSFVPLVMYIPSLALNQVTGLNIHMITPISCAICVFYTTIGGLRAVVWTDVLQWVLMSATVVFIIFLGFRDAGSINNVWEAADRGGRLNFFSFDPSPFVRMSTFTVVIGFTTQLVSNFGLSPVLIQRCLSLPNISIAKRAVWIFLLGIAFFFIYGYITGLIMYTKYETCDPTLAGQTQKMDQILPMFVMQIGKNIPGLPGVFIAGIFSAALSTMSSTLNTLSGTVYNDFFKIYLNQPSERTASNIMKGIVVVLGVIVALLALVVERLGSVYQLALSLSSVTAGGILGIFAMGMLCRQANSKGVIVGGITSVLLVSTVMAGAQKFHKMPTLPMQSDGCEVVIQAPSETTNVEEAFWLFRISFMYYAFLGLATVFIVGLPISLLTGGQKTPLDEALFAPFRRRTAKVTQTDQGDKGSVEVTRF